MICHSSAPRFFFKIFLSAAALRFLISFFLRDPQHMSWLVSRPATWSGIPAVVSTMGSTTPSARCKQLVPWSMLTMWVKIEQLHDVILPVHGVAFQCPLNFYLGVAQHSRICVTNEDEFWHYKSQLVEAIFLQILLSPWAVKCTSECSLGIVFLYKLIVCSAV